ncbi:ATP-binding protein [Bifidobacterium oedipodis]|uniref:AAA domain-containing protein n=1 Tax=Bifidobacterium oedipodis TaxID=2675322 RepID=A0A7Y0HS75_9BIFI|nr:ATP-binding protein [Bifidobacterium sp. DSM 109957]NMM93706.1 AAA domain-containing protein [Bifidobacterium sp. DSM 109957]
MKRTIDETLLRWSRNPKHLPLVLCGARQVGKTYALQNLGRAHYDSCAYINLMSESARAVFDAGYNAARTLENISVFTGVKITPGRTLIIIDEIQEVPAALTLMKAFAEETPEQHIAAAGSYLGLAYHAGQSFPVGKVDTIDMYPLTFLEFLSASGEEALSEIVENLDFDRMNIFSDRLERMLRRYYFVGGMPRAVTDFLEGDNDYIAARTRQTALLSDYDNDFSKHGLPTPGVDVERVRLAFRSIPSHLGRENHKFVFGHIAQGARRAQYDTAIQFIVDSGLAHRVYRVSKPQLPLRDYEDLSSFKLYMHDIGLLGAAMNVHARDVLLSNKAFEEYKGAMTEQYVCQQLVANGQTPYYWSSGKGTAEVDFVLERDGSPAPLEVKAEENVHAKSLQLLCKDTSLHGFRSSMRGYRVENWMTNIPLYAVGPYFNPKNDPANFIPPELR